MMRILLSTRVQNTTVIHTIPLFNRELFLKLSPPFPKSELLRFDGCKKGDLVKLRIRLLFAWQYWDSEIIEESQTDHSWQFVDSGIRLPFFLSGWLHKHSLVQSGNDLLVIDDIQFKAHNRFFELIIYPALWIQFALRKPIYKKELGKS
jgi:ligand-binding SRPBCC domain-containing protein